MDKIEYLVAVFFYHILRRLPYRVSLILAAGVKYFAQYIIGYRRKVAYNNLSDAFPNKSKTELKIIINEIYRNFVLLWIEILQTWRLNDEYIDKNFQIHNWELVEKAVGEGRGVIFVTGHIGNFEWTAHCLAIKLGNTYAIMKKVKNPHINDLIVKLRECTGLKLILSKVALRRGLKLLRDGNTLLVAGDQDARKLGIFVNFMNKTASTATGTAIFHLKTNAPMVFVAGIRRNLGIFDIYFEEIPDSNSKEINDNNIKTITQSHTAILEKWICKYPGQYFWTHRRWKTQPKNTS
jgi:KDO2-lipid IV(A) lauroyltransferase